MANASTKVRAAFQNLNPILTLAQIKDFAPDLRNSEISMALCYLMRQRYLTREQVDNPSRLGRRKIWQYKYFAKKLPKQDESTM